MAKDYKPDAAKLQELVSRGVQMNMKESTQSNLSHEITSGIQSEAVEVQGVEGFIKQPERVKRKTVPKGDYESLFMEAKEFKERRAVYISRDKHQEISYILKTIDSGDVSVGAFVENIINHHLEMYRDEIDTLFDSKCKKPSQKFGR